MAKDVFANHRRIGSGAVVSLGDIELSAPNLSDNAVRNKRIARLEQNYVTRAGRACKGHYGYFPRWSQRITHAPTLDEKHNTPSALEMRPHQLFGDFRQRTFTR